MDRRIQVKSRYQNVQYFNKHCILFDNSPLMCIHLKEAIALFPGTYSVISSFLHAFTCSSIRQTLLYASRVPDIGYPRERGLALTLGTWQTGCGGVPGRQEGGRGVIAGTVAAGWGWQASRRSAGERPERRHQRSRSTRPLTWGHSLRRAVSR